MGLALLACCLALALYFLLAAALQHKSPPPETLALRPVLAEETAGLTQPGTGVDLNRAGAEELMTLPGIGPHLAGQIIAQRAIHPFYCLEDLRIISGIGERRLDALRGLAYVTDPSAWGTGLGQPTPESLP